MPHTFLPEGLVTLFPFWNIPSTQDHLQGQLLKELIHSHSIHSNNTHLAHGSQLGARARIYQYCLCLLYFPLTLVLVSCGCCDKIQQTRWLETEINSLTIEEIRSQVKVSTELAPSRGSEGENVHASLLPVALDNPWHLLA